MTTGQLRAELNLWLASDPVWKFQREYKFGRLYLHQEAPAKTYLLVRDDRAEVIWQDWEQEHRESILLTGQFGCILGFIKDVIARRMADPFRDALEDASKRVDKCRRELEVAEIEYSRLRELGKMKVNATLTESKPKEGKIK